MIWMQTNVHVDSSVFLISILLVVNDEFALIDVFTTMFFFLLKYIANDKYELFSSFFEILISRRETKWPSRSNPEG